MASQFFGLNIAASGLRAAMAAYNTTANNVSNADTTGYTRQKVVQQAANALETFTTYGCAGAGVDTISIQRVRDSFYDTRYRNNETLLGQYTQKQYYNNLVENYLNDNGTTGFSSLYTALQTSLQSVMTAAGTTATKTSFISAATSVAEYFNNISGNLQAEQSDLNDEIKTSTDSINSMAEEIATLNQQINTVEMTGTTANDLRDKRDSIVDNLSKLVNVAVKESKVIDENDPDRDTGATRYQVSIAGGQTLVDMYEYKKLVCVARESDEGINQNDISGLYNIKWVSSDYKSGSTNYLGDFRLDNQNIGGTLQGLIEMRDGNNSQYFNGTSASWNASSRKVTIETKSGYLSDMGKCTLPEDGTITIGSRTYNYDSWTYEGSGKYTFTLEGGTDKDFSRITTAGGDSCKVGSAVSYQGIPYYMEQMNEWIRSFSSEVNKIMESGYTSDGTKGVNLFTADKTTDSSAQYSYEEMTGTNKGYYDVTAANFAVNSTLTDNADLLATKADKTEGASEFGNLTSLKTMMAEKEIFRGATAGEFLDKVLADVSLNTSNSKTMETTYTSLQNTINNQRLSTSGVDEDEEAEAMVQYSNSYTLSSKMIQTLTEIYDRLILQTGV
ncbi:MAG: flagellar hook-associated protein FlgK [Butyrivibrio sp.]|jgi:flagellar hook-associated protein 1 FlgK|nr:flagellar hook-associated protein FlgK [Butyrivibrio sp.]